MYIKPLRLGFDVTLLLPFLLSSTFLFSQRVSNDGAHIGISTGTHFIVDDANLDNSSNIKNEGNIWVTQTGTINNFGSIEGLLTLTGNVAKSVNLGNLESLELANSGTVTVTSDCSVSKLLRLSSGVLESNGYDFILSSDSNVTCLVHNNGGSTSGDFICQRYTTGTGSHFISSPTTNATVQELDDDIKYFLIYPSTKGYFYDETSTTYGFTSRWAMIPGLSFPMTPGEGYTFVYDADTGLVLDIDGPLNSGFIQSNLTYTLSQPIPNTNLQSPEGWNLIGNPYPSPIDFDKMSLNKPASMQNSYYHWDGVSELYISYVNSISSDTLFNNNVGPFQSFFVRIDPNNQVNAQYQFTDAVRVTDPDEVISPFLKLNRKLFRLRIEGQGSFNHTVVYFEPSATALFDSDYDAYYLNSGQSNPIEFASVTPNNLVSINGLPLNSSISQTTIPLYTSVAVAGTYEISLEEFTNFEVGELVILNDLLLSTSHVLNNSSYVFQASPNDPTNRFEINATNPNVILPVSVSSNNVNCSSFYPNPTTDYVNYNYYSIDNKSLTLSVSDISGITIYKSNYNAVFGTNNILLDFKNYPSGSYIINVSDDNNQIVDKQTIIKE